MTSLAIERHFGFKERSIALDSFRTYSVANILFAPRTIMLINYSSSSGRLEKSESSFVSANSLDISSMHTMTPPLGVSTVVKYDRMMRRIVIQQRIQSPLMLTQPYSRDGGGHNISLNKVRSETRPLTRFTICPGKFFAIPSRMKSFHTVNPRYPI